MPHLTYHLACFILKNITSILSNPMMKLIRRQAKGSKVSFDEILENVRNRDYIDSNREHSPLKQADDAILLDNSRMNQEEQLDWIVKLIRSRFPSQD